MILIMILTMRLHGNVIVFLNRNRIVKSPPIVPLSIDSYSSFVGYTVSLSILTTVTIEPFVRCSDTSNDMFPLTDLSYFSSRIMTDRNCYVMCFLLSLLFSQIYKPLNSKSFRKLRVCHWTFRFFSTGVVESGSRLYSDLHTVRVGLD